MAGFSFYMRPLRPLAETLLNGVQMCQSMQANPEYQAIPFVLMSAFPTAINATSCRFAALLAKPFDLDALVQLIARLSRLPS